MKINFFFALIVASSPMQICAQLDFVIPGHDYFNNISNAEVHPYCDGTGTWLNIVNRVPNNSNQIVTAIDHYQPGDPTRYKGGAVIGYDFQINKYKYSTYKHPLFFF